MSHFYTDESRETNRDMAYKGYLIRTHPWNGTMWIEKNAHPIAWVSTMVEAKQQIDQLTAQ